MKKRKSPKSRGGEVAIQLPTSFKPIGMSLLIGALTFVVLIMLFAVVMSFQDIPSMLFGPMSVAALIVGCMAAGFVSGRLMRSSGLIYGTCCGGILYAIVLLGSCMVGGGFGLLALLKLIIALLSGAIGGVVGVNMRSHRRK